MSGRSDQTISKSSSSFVPKVVTDVPLGGTIDHVPVSFRAKRNSVYPVLRSPGSLLHVLKDNARNLLLSISHMDNEPRDTGSSSIQVGSRLRYCRPYTESVSTPIYIEGIQERGSG